MKNQKNATEMWNVSLEVDETINDDRSDFLMEELASYSVSVSSAPHNNIHVTLSLPASNLMQAIKTAVAVTEQATAANVIYVEALPTDEFDDRSGLEPIPALVSVSEAADMLGLTKVRVNQMITEGKFSTARKVGQSFVLAYTEVQRRQAHTPQQIAHDIVHRPQD